MPLVVSLADCTHRAPHSHRWNIVRKLPVHRKSQRSVRLQWQDFIARYEARYHQKPDHFAALAYDQMRILLDAICRAGLNKGRIRDALTGLTSYKGVTGDMIFDPNCKNIALYSSAIFTTVRSSTRASPCRGRTPRSGKIAFGPWAPSRTARRQPVCRLASSARTQTTSCIPPKLRRL